MTTNVLKREYKIFERGQGLWGILPSPVAGFVIAVLGYAAGFSAFVLVCAFLGTAALVEFILWRAKSKGSRNAYLAALTVLLIAAAGWATKQHIDKLNSYSLTYDGLTVLRGGRTNLNGEGRVTGVNVRLDVGNATDIPLWYKVERQYAKFGDNASSLDNPGATVQKLLPGHALYLANNEIKGYFENGRYHDGEAEFIVDYGKVKDKLDRRFTWTANVQFFLCPGTGLLCGDVTTTNLQVKNERISEQSDTPQ